MEIPTNPIKKSKWWSKLLTIVGILFIILCVLLVYGTTINNRWYKLLVVTSGSMSPIFEAGDLICIIRMDPDRAKVGDIVTFKSEEGILTHRIVEIKADGEIVTKGDANKVNDSWPNNWKLGKVETKYLFRIPKLGYFISWWSGIFHGTGAILNDKVTSNGNKIVASVPTPAPMAQIQTPTDSPVPTITPEETPSTEATASIEPTTSPESTISPETTISLEPTTSPEITASIEPTITPEETPLQDGSQ